MAETLIEKLNNYFKTKDVDQVIMFGSFARGSSTKKSDLDLIIIKQTNESFFDRYNSFYDLYDKLKMPIDLLIYSPDEWKKIKSRRFFVNILKEAATVYVGRKEPD